MFHIESRFISIKNPALENTVPDPRSMEEDVEERDLLNYVFTTLLNDHMMIPHAKDVLKLLYYVGLEPKDAGNRIGIGAEYVRQIDRRALSGLRELVRRSEFEKIG